jgi:cell division transport system ATP-binding protein
MAITGTMTPVTLIQLRAATKRYADTCALDDVTLDIEAGEFVYLIGPSGAGKTTMLKLLTRELVADDGDVLIDGEDIGSWSGRRLPELRRVVASVPQDHKLLANRTVEENITFALSVLGWRQRTARRRAGDVLDLVGLGAFSRRLPHELSSGERQRVAIARAIAGGPKLLLADEPTGNLDPAATASIAVLLDDVARSGCSVVMATHDVRIVDAMRRRVIALRSGAVVSDGLGAYNGAKV